MDKNMLKIMACAKINLSLDITGIREDGYHLISSVMQSVDLHDTIIINKCENGIKVVSSDNTLGNADDICFKAAQLFFEKSGVVGGAEIIVTKNIPLSAGLGGGSADAAAVLIGLNKLFNTPLDNNELSKAALSLGADVPYFLFGGTVLVGGIGEVCEKIMDIPDCFIVLAKREQKKSTKHMYDVIDNCEEPISVDNEKMISYIDLQDINGISNCAKNVFSLAWNDNITTEILNSFEPLYRS